MYLNVNTTKCPENGAFVVELIVFLNPVVVSLLQSLITSFPKNEVKLLYYEVVIGSGSKKKEVIFRL